MKHIQDECLKTIIIFVLINLLSATSSWSKSIKGKLSLIGDVTHLEFEGSKDWDYKIEQKDNREVWVIIPHLSDVSAREMMAWRDSRIESIKVNKNESDQKTYLKIKFSNNYIENFDYLTDSPSRLIIDFYVDKEKITAEQKKQTEHKTSQVIKNRQKMRVKDKNIRTKGKYTQLNKFGRAPSGSELINDSDYSKKDKYIPPTIGVKKGIYDAGDPNYDRFKIRDYEVSEESIIASRQNIYIRFPMLKMPTSNLSRILKNPPEYKISAKDDLENKEARFLLTLFNNKRNATYLNTYKYFIKKYPESYYSEILSYMAADVHFRLWKKNKHFHHYERARNLYRKALKNHPESPLKERITLMLNYADLENKNALETIRNFLDFTNKFSESEEIDRAKMALADGYFMLNKFDNAMSVYDDIEKNYKDFERGVEARYRRGDVEFKKKNYEASIKEYLLAIKKHPKHEKTFPNAHYNLGESYFWLGKYQKSLNHYIEYLKLFPSHEHNGFAMTRIGELLEILGAPKSKVMSAFLESFYRFETNSGSKVARVRMLSQRMKGMKEKELKKTLTELNGIVKSTDLPKIEEFVNLMITDGFRRRKEYDKAIDYLITYYQKNPTTVSLSFFKERIVGNIADSIHEKLENDKYFESLRINGRYANTWLRKNSRIDIDYFKGNSFELAGVHKEAERIYKEVWDRLHKIKGTREEVERRVREYLPSLDSLNLRLANVSLQQRKYRESYKYLKKIKRPDRFSHNEKVEQVRLYAKVYKERGDIGKTINYLKKLVTEWKDKKDLLAPTHLILAEIELEGRRFKDAELSAQNSITYYKNIDDKNDSELEKYKAEALKIKADSLYLQKKHLASVELYLDLLKNYENKISLDSVRFRAGEILFQKGDIKGAEKVWSSFKASSDNFYKKLADEKLKDLKWSDSYKKYYNRIPAMVGVK